MRDPSPPDPATPIALQTAPAVEDAAVALWLRCSLRQHHGAVVSEAVPAALLRILATEGSPERP